MYKKPHCLKKNDSIGIVSPAGCISEKPVLYAKDVLEKMGYKVVLGNNVFKYHGVFAGTDAERIEDFQAMVDNPDVSMILCSRGGYGCARIVDSIDFSSFKVLPKWIVGFSDVTVLHAAMEKMGVVSCHAPMPTNFPNLSKSALKYLKTFFKGDALQYKIDANSSNMLGEAEAPIVGGNLSIIVSLLGSPYQIESEGKILFVEDVGEKYYQIDRMLQSLRLAGYFDKIRGLIVGSFTNSNEDSFGKKLDEIILHYVKHRNIPVCFDFPAGHMNNNHPLVFNTNALLSVKEKYAKILFG